MRMSSKQTFDDVQSTRSIVSSIVVCTNSTRVVQAGFMDHIYDYRGCVYRLKKSARRITWCGRIGALFYRG